MKRNSLRILSLVLLLALLSGCAALFERDYLVITPHEEQPTGGGLPPSEELRAENYQGLKQNILRLISEHVEDGVIRLYNYSGDAQADVRKACMETTLSEPLGAYAVEYMSFDLAHVINYYEVGLNITYRRTAEQISSIQKAVSPQDFERLLLDAVRESRDGLTVEVPFLYSEQYDIEALLTARYYSDPLDLILLPSSTSTVYPESGWTRIIEIGLGYDYPPASTAGMSATLHTAANHLVGQIAPGLDEQSQYLAAQEQLARAISYRPDAEEDLAGDANKDLSYTAYGGLVLGRAVSEGYALSFQALCNLLELECMVVSGRYNGLTHHWNLVRIGEHWYHLDTALYDGTGALSFSLRTDAQMSATHLWSNSAYPSCGGEEIVLVDETAITEDGEPPISG